MTIRRLLTGPTSVLGLMLFLGLVTACSTDLTPCESDVDCVITCECPDRPGEAMVGPFVCRAGTCGASHAQERDCERVCSNQPGSVPSIPDDDDSAAGDDDDSGR
jgi:hypothetical protein